MRGRYPPWHWIVRLRGLQWFYQHEEKIAPKLTWVVFLRVWQDEGGRWTDLPAPVKHCTDFDDSLDIYSSGRHINVGIFICKMNPALGVQFSCPPPRFQKPKTTSENHIGLENIAKYLLQVCVSRFWCWGGSGGSYRGGFCEKLWETSPMSDTASASRL